MDQEIRKGVVATILIIPLMTVGKIILAATGCIFAFYLVRGVVRMFSGAGEHVKNKVKAFTQDVKTEAKRLEASQES